MRTVAATLLAVIALLVAGCASGRAAPGEKLYFALELREQGKLVGKPKLLGEAGKTLFVEKVPAAGASYQLALSPSQPHTGGSYRVKLEVDTPRSHGLLDLDLFHGQERAVVLGQTPGQVPQLEVKLLLMKVDSPEFRALMQLTGPRASGSGGGSI